MNAFAPSFLLSMMMVVVGASLVLERADERLERLSDEHRAWLERDVVYIITDRERDVFLTLETLEERERFIESFWRRRDRNRATAVNEFKEEHYRRVEHANEFLGRETFREGWRTDRGRYYILLGEPLEIQRYEGYNQLVSVELWFYRGAPPSGLPAHFYLLFFRKNDLGEYTLYHPVGDGPRSLLRAGPFLGGADNLRALDELKRISPELASASLSYDTSDPPDLVTGRPSVGTELLLARIEESRRRAIRTDYLDAWSRYGNRVGAEYSFNYVPSRSAFSIFAGPERTPVVHFSIEIDAENFALETDDDRRFYTTLDLTVEARSKDGTLVFARDEEAPIELSRAEVQEIQAVPFAYRGNFPLIPGRFTVTVIVRNRVIQQYTVAERELEIEPFDEGGPRLTDVLLAHESERVEGGSGATIEASRIGSWRVEPAVGHLFAAGERAYVLTQALAAPPNFTIRLEVLNERRDVLRSIESKVGDDGTVLESLDTRDLLGGSYELRAQLLSPEDELVSERTTVLSISPRANVVRPGFSYRQAFDARVPGVLALVRGEQLWRLGRFDEARLELEEAVARGKRQLPEAWWRLAYAYLRDERPDKALELLTPMEPAFPDHYEVIAGLGLAHNQKREHAKAADYLKRARALRPPDTALWNALGEAELALGNVEAAREAFGRSLELDPAQEAIRDRLGALSNREQ